MASMPFVAFSQAIEEVTVTATRKVESLQDIPLSVQALDAEALESQHIETGRDLAIAIPGFSFTSGVGSGSASRMRGLIMPAVTAASVDANQTMINGHTIPNTTFGEMGFFDAERIEILNGPQGTLYGRNAVTGIINLITKRPGAGNYFNISAGEGGYGLIKTGFDFPVNDNLSGRLAINSLTIDGTVDNLALGNSLDNRRNTSVRLSLDYEFDDGSMILFNHDDITVDDHRLNLGTISCNRDNFFGCSSSGTNVADHINRPGFESGGVAAVFQKTTMLRTNLTDDSYAATDAARSTNIDTVKKNFNPIRRQDDTFTQMQYLRDLVSPMGDVQMIFKVTDRSRDFFLSDDNDHSYHETAINNFYTSSTFEDSAGVNIFAGADGIYNIENQPLYCVGTQTVRSATASECSVVTGDEQQYELNFISDFDGPFNFVAGVYAYESEGTNQYVVQSTELAMSQDFTLNPISQMFAGGQDDSSGFFHAGVIDAVLSSSTAQGGATQAATAVKNAGGSGAAMLAQIQTSLAPTLNALVDGMCLKDAAGESSITITANGPVANAAYAGSGQDVCAKKQPVQVAGNMIDSRTDRSSKAVYGELYYNITDDTQMTFGARYMDDRYTNRVLSTLVDTAYTPNAANAANAAAIAACKSATAYEECFGYAHSTGIGKDETTTYKFGIKHQYETDLTEGMVFASYTEGNRPGGANAQTGSLYDNSETESIQIGTRNTFLDGAFQLNVTAFNDKQASAQVSEIHVTGSNVLPIDMTHQGIEIQSSLFVTENTVLTLNGLFTDSEIDQSTGANVIGPLGNVIASGSNLLDPHNPTAATSFGTPLNATAFGAALVGVYGFDPVMAAGVKQDAGLAGNDAFNGIIPVAVNVGKTLLTAAGFPDVTGDQLYIVDNAGNILINPAGLVLDTGMQIETGGKITYRNQSPHSSGVSLAAALAGVCGGAIAAGTTTATCVAGTASNSVMQDVSGNKIPGVSEYEYSVGVTHFFEAFNGSGAINLTYSDTDGVYLDVWNNQRYQVEGSDDISGNISFTPNNGDWSYNFWVRNLEDNRDITSVNRTSNLQGAASFVTFQEGRKIGIDLKREF